MLESEFDQVVIWFTFLEVSHKNRIVLDFWIRILHLMLNLLHSCLYTCLNHDILRDVKYLERVRRTLNKKVEGLEILRSLTLLESFGLHAAPPVVLRNVDPLKIGNEHVPVILYDLAALLQNAFQHFVAVDEGRDSVGEHNAVHFLA